MPAYKAYTIVEEARVSDTIAAAVIEHPRVEEVFEALKWLVARSPDKGTVVEHEGTSYRLIIFAPIRVAKNSQILAKYTVDDIIGEIIIHDVYVLPYADADAYAPEAFDLDA